uniref:ephrin-B2a-like n=1 Tax=Myxine glutinosa TaxID=7769 RepID=UPI00358E3CD6
MRVLVLCLSLAVAGARTLDPIYWSTSNPHFSPGRSFVLYPDIGDKVDIVCPRLSADALGERHRLFLVGAEEAEACETRPDRRPLLSCSRPARNVHFTLKVQEFSPSVLGLEFRRGEDYYIISTSTGRAGGLDNRRGGVCSTHGMRLMLRIGQAPKEEEMDQSGEPNQTPGWAKDSEYKEEISKERKSSDGVGRDSQFPGQYPPTSLSPPATPSPSASTLISSWHLVILVGAVSSAVIVVLLILLFFTVIRLRRQHRRPPLPGSLPLSNPNTPKLVGGMSGIHGGGEDLAIPLRTMDQSFCPHYEKFSGDYGHPVYIVQEVQAQSPANVYYKV